MKAIQRTGIAPTDVNESALIATLAPGSYTAVMGGKSADARIGLIELYDLDARSDASLQNVSTRGSVGTGDDVVIAGIIVGDGQSPTVVARGIGPSLSDLGVSGALADPVLELHDANGQLVAMNDNWSDAQKEEITATGLAPTRGREAAIVQSLAPGNYSTILKGNRGETGVALVELYLLKP